MGTKLLATVAALASTLALASGAAAITNGQPDGSTHPNVGAVFALPPGAPPEAFPDFFTCSASLVAPGVVLTAAHCVPPPGVPAQIYITFAADFTSGDPGVLIPGVPTIDPLYSGCDCADPHDIAVIRFAADAARGLKPVKLPKLGLLDKVVAKRDKDADHRATHPRVGKPHGGDPGRGKNDKRDKLKFAKDDFVDVGYGITSAADLDYGVRRVAVSGDPTLSESYLTLSQDASQGFGGTCVGDSGGPQFLGDVQVSMTLGGDDNCAQFGVNLRLDTAATQAFLASQGVRF